MAIEPKSNEQLESPGDGAFPLSGELEVSELSHRVSQGVGIAEEQAVAAVRIMRQSSIEIGPHPSADEVARLNAIKPELGTRLIENFLMQQEHHRSLDERMMTIAEGDADRENAWLSYVSRGQGLGFATTVILLACSLVCAFVLHQYWLSAAFIAAPTIGVVAQFVQGAKR